MTWTVEASYAHCRTLARRAATNFYLSFFTLPRAKRQAMYALYAFLRRTDDLGDNPGPLESRRAALVRWRLSLERSLAGEFDSLLHPALADTVARYEIPPEYLFAAIDGVEMDLAGGQYETFDDLCRYCHKVASVVGLACIHIWGFRGPEALEPARKCGIAFQLTNILRDLKEDAANGRVYLPQQDLRRFNYSIDDLRQGVRDVRFTSLMQFEIERTESLYREGAELPRWLEPDGRKVFTAMVGIYRGLLDEIKRRDGDVFSCRVRLSTWRKLRIAGNAWLARTPVQRSPVKPGAGAP